MSEVISVEHSMMATYNSSFKNRIKPLRAHRSTGDQLYRTNYQGVEPIFEIEDSETNSESQTREKTIVDN